MLTSRPKRKRDPGPRSPFHAHWRRLRLPALVIGITASAGIIGAYGCSPSGSSDPAAQPVTGVDSDDGDAGLDPPQGAGYAPKTVAPSTVFFVEEAAAVLQHAPHAIDLDGDDWPDALGFENVFGTMVPLQGTDGCEEALFAPGRAHRDTQLGDFDDDGQLELIANTYSNVTEAESVAVYCQQQASPFDFEADPDVLGESFGGHGETISVFDFDNDGDLDIFIAYYTMDPELQELDDHLAAPQDGNVFLRNDGDNNFVDVAPAAGVDQPNMMLRYRIEGVDVVDYNGDGWLDFYAASALFLNNQDGTFSDIAEVVGLPTQFDEGARFADLDNDGQFDLVINRSAAGGGIAIYYNRDGAFEEADPVDPDFLNDAAGYGLAIADINFDGWQDIIAPDRDDRCQTLVYMNGPDGFYRVTGFPKTYCGDLMTNADFNRDGKLDLLYRVVTPTVFTNDFPGDPNTFAVIALDEAGRRNQHGRRITARPADDDAIVLTRAVDPGSGFMSSSPYPVVFNSPSAEPHDVTIHFASGPQTVTVSPGQVATVRENSEPTYRDYRF